MKRRMAFLLTLAVSLTTVTGSVPLSGSAEEAICAEEEIIAVNEEAAADLLLEEDAGTDSAADQEEETAADSLGSIFIENVETVDVSDIPKEVIADEGLTGLSADSAEMSEESENTNEISSGITDEAAFMTSDGNSGISTASEDSDDEESDIIELGISVTFGQTEAREMLQLINELRTGDDAWYWNSDDETKTTCSDLSELTYDYDLEAVAMQRAAEIALSFSHTRPDGTMCYTALGENSYVYYAAGENIAAGQTSAASAFTSWAEEDEDYSGQGHRRNMLSSSFNAIGIGHVYYNGIHYWVQEFAYTTSTSTAVSANDSATDMTVNVAESYISGVTVEADPEEENLIFGESVDLPTITTKISLTETWPSGRIQPVTADYSWTVGDGSIAEISGSQLAAKAVGTTNLTATVLAETATVPVNVQYDLTKGILEVPETSYVYDGSEKIPQITVYYDTAELTENTDYTLTYSDNINAGTASVTVTGMGSYTGSLTGTFTISKAEQTLTASVAASSIEVGETTKITVDGKGTVTYTSSDSSVASVSSDGVITGAGEGNASITVSAAGDENYNPAETTLTVTVTSPAVTSTTITSSTDTSTTVTSSTIAGTKLSSVKNTASRKITVKWKKKSGVTGYQIQYSTSKTFKKGNKTVKVSGAKKTKKVISKLKKGKTYYVRVRTYKKVNGVTYYSAWSTKKKVSIKK
ncbi:MAG: CAP domain-containing protein [Lachnospiraceae bacterium]|nr:CAP domain-containing protein [Lachnospiraceae bacterium]